MFRNMVTSLIQHERLETTDVKARQLRPMAEKMITLAKRGDLHARRQALAYIRDKTITHRLFEQLKERYLDVQGGYVRIVKKGHRKGDGAPISVVQLLFLDEDKKKGKKKSKAERSAGAAEPKKKKEPKVKKEGKADPGNDQTEKNGINHPDSKKKEDVT
jgi:large subunit ribosomal protein L17